MSTLAELDAEFVEEYMEARVALRARLVTGEIVEVEDVGPDVIRRLEGCIAPERVYKRLAQIQAEAAALRRGGR